MGGFQKGDAPIQVAPDKAPDDVEVFGKRFIDGLVFLLRLRPAALRDQGIGQRNAGFGVGDGIGAGVVLALKYAFTGK